MSEWISVKDRLPEKHGWYLTAHKKVSPTDSGMKVRFFCHGRFTTDKIEVTYWRLLPEYPEDETASPCIRKKCASPASCCGCPEYDEWKEKQNEGTGLGNEWRL